MKFKLFSDFVLIRPDGEQKTTAGGLALPDGVKLTEKKYFGTVIAIGDECKKVKEGDRVLYVVMKALMFEPEKEKLVVVKEVDIIGLVNG